VTAHILLLLATVGACAPAGTRTPPDPAAGDTLRGEIAEVGSEPGTQVAMRPAGTILTGPLEAPLKRLHALEVTVWGHSDGPRRFRVERFEVRASGGVAAVDGELAMEGERYLLLTHDGRRLPLPHIPTALRGRAGTRVWIAGPLDRSPDSFGIIGITRRPEE
jgi:hypothetical protein